MSVLKLYKAADDQLISEAPTTTYAVKFTLRADLEEVSAPKRLYAKCDTGYQATAVTVTPTGTGNIMWQLHPSDSATPPAVDHADWEDYGDPVALGTVTTANRYFWVRAKAETGELMGPDEAVTLVASGVGEVV